MASLKLTLPVLLILFALCSADLPEEENVLVLDPSNFDEGIKSSEFTLVEFYAPWCGHCKTLAPQYAAAATLLKEQKQTNIRLAKVDVNVHNDLGARFGVQGFPTLKFFKNFGNSLTEYNGGRTTEEILAWVKKKSGPAVTTLNSVEEAETLVNNNKFVVLGFFSDLESPNAKIFSTTADTVEGVSFGFTSSDALKEKYSVTKDKDTIILFKPFDEKLNTYDGEFSVLFLQEFISKNSIPTVVELTPETIRTIFGSALQNIFFYFHGEKKDEIEQFTELAKANKGKYLFSTVDTTQPSGKRVVDYFAITSTPSFLLVVSSTMLKYRYESSDYSQDKLQTFLNDFSDGKLSPHFKSEEVQADWNAKPVKVLFGKNHDEVAFDTKKHVFVEYYAPWCGHCKTLAPIWDKLAETLENHDEIVIAKMDATLNEVKDVRVTGFPTLKLFLAGESNQKIVDYEGDRSFDDLIKFLEKHTGLNLKTSDSDTTLLDNDIL